MHSAESNPKNLNNNIHLHRSQILSYKDAFGESSYKISNTEESHTHKHEKKKKKILSNQSYSMIKPKKWNLEIEKVSEPLQTDPFYEEFHQRLLNENKVFNNNSNKGFQSKSIIHEKSKINKKVSSENNIIINEKLSLVPKKPGLIDLIISEKQMDILNKKKSGDHNAKLKEKNKPSHNNVGSYSGLKNFIGKQYGSFEEDQALALSTENNNFQHLAESTNNNINNRRFTNEKYNKNDYTKKLSIIKSIHGEEHEESDQTQKTNKHFQPKKESNINDKETNNRVNSSKKPTGKSNYPQISSKERDPNVVHHSLSHNKKVSSQNVSYNKKESNKNLSQAKMENNLNEQNVNFKKDSGLNLPNFPPVKIEPNTNSTTPVNVNNKLSQNLMEREIINENNINNLDLGSNQSIKSLISKNGNTKATKNNNEVLPNIVPINIPKPKKGGGFLCFC